MNSRIRMHHTVDLCEGDTALVSFTDKSEDAPVRVPLVIQHHGDSLQIDIYLHDGDGEPDRSIVLPIADLLAGWTP